jgi:hypothetical protein
MTLSRPSRRNPFMVCQSAWGRFSNHLPGKKSDIFSELTKFETLTKLFWVFELPFHELVLMFRSTVTVWNWCSANAFQLEMLVNTQAEANPSLACCKTWLQDPCQGSALPLRLGVQESQLSQLSTSDHLWNVLSREFSATNKMQILQVGSIRLAMSWFCFQLFPWNYGNS